MLPGLAAGEQPWDCGGCRRRHGLPGLDEFADQFVERLGDQDRFSAEPQPHLPAGYFDVVDGGWLIVAAVWA